MVTRWILAASVALTAIQTHQGAASPDTNFFSEDLALMKTEALRAASSGLVRDDVEAAYGRILRKLRDLLGHDGHPPAIPETTLQRIVNNGGHLPDGTVQRTRSAGVVVIRNLTTPAEAGRLLASLDRYVRRKADPGADLYWSKAQTEVRQDRRVASVVAGALLELWRSSSGPDLRRPCVAATADPAEVFVAGGVTGDGTVRIGGWSHLDFAEAFRRVFRPDPGRLDPDGYDPFLLPPDDRSSSSVLSVDPARLFGGLLSLRRLERGAVRVLPNLREVTALMLLRPLLGDVPADLIPGYRPGSQPHLDLSPRWHGELTDLVVDVPDLGPGDSVWWHPDAAMTINSVLGGRTTIDDGIAVAVVAGINLSVGPGPGCHDDRRNRNYRRKMAHAFTLGTRPPDSAADTAALKTASQPDSPSFGKTTGTWPSSAVPEASLPVAEEQGWRATFEDLDELGRKCLFDLAD